MGKSLTFRGTVYEASELMKSHRCKDPICDTHLWKVKHELDMARLKLKRLEDELNTKGIHVPQDPIKLNDAQEDIHYDKVKSDTQKRMKVSVSESLTVNPQDFQATVETSQRVKGSSPIFTKATIYHQKDDQDLKMEPEPVKSRESCGDQLFPGGRIPKSEDTSSTSSSGVIPSFSSWRCHQTTTAKQLQVPRKHEPRSSGVEQQQQHEEVWNQSNPQHRKRLKNLSKATEISEIETVL